jgi:hypothetical protein
MILPKGYKFVCRVCKNRRQCNSMFKVGTMNDDINELT